MICESDHFKSRRGDLSSYFYVLLNFKAVPTL